MQQQAPRRRGGGGGFRGPWSHHLWNRTLPLMFFWKFVFFVILQGIQNLFGPGPSRILSGALSKFTGEHPFRSMISIKLQSNFIYITIRYGCSPVNWLHVFRIPFPENTSGGLLLNMRSNQLCLPVFVNGTS